MSVRWSPGFACSVVVAASLRAPIALAKPPGLREGAFSAEGGSPYVLVTQAPAQTLDVSLYRTAPLASNELPACVSEDLPLGSSRFECWTPFRDCVRSAELTGGAGDFRVRIGAASGSECHEPWGDATLAFWRVDFADHVTRAYLRSDEAAAEVGTKLSPKLGPEPVTPGAQGLLASIFRDVFGRTAALPLRSAFEWLRSPHGDLLERCGAPGSAKCPADKAERVAKSLSTELRRVESKAPRQRPVPPAKPKPRTSPPAWLGTWLGPHATDGPFAGSLELEPDENGKARLTFGEYLEGPDFGDCRSYGAPFGATEVRCEQCGRRLALRIQGDRALVRPLGDAWRVDCDEGHYQPLDAWKYVFSLTHVDAVDAFAPRFVEAVAHSDLGSSGGRLYYTVLGKNPQQTAQNLGRLAARAYAESGSNPSELTVSALIELVGQVESNLLLLCRGLPGGDPASTCKEPEVRASVAETVRVWRSAHPRRGP